MASAPRPPRSSVLSIGVFDGVHLGHRFTLAQARAAADARGADLVVVTFDPHPLAVLRPERAPKMLTTLEQRLALLEETGVDAVFVLTFDEAASLQSAPSFVEELLVAHLGAAEVLVGEDFRFGHDRAGDVELLRNLGAQLGFEVSGLALSAHEGDAISSTRIRALLAAGEVEGAAELLGRPHEAWAPVVHGDGRGGAELGYPTANLGLSPDQVLPGDGVYAGWYRDEALGPRPAAISVGRRPTFLEGAEPIIEAFVLDLDEDLYGRQAGVSFLARLRGEERFESVEDLIAQMGLDAKAAHELCAARSEEAPRGPIPC
mgnify:CR=1 FL=1